MQVMIGEKAPNLKISEWVQGLPTNLSQEKDHIVLVEVFQVNCPGCFLYGIPEAINIYNNYKNEGVIVIGLATAFEDFDKNTLDNLKMLAETGEVIGDTKKHLGQYGYLNNNKTLQYKIPFPLAMDEIKKNTGEIDEKDVIELVRQQIPDFDSSYTQEGKDKIITRAKEYIRTKEYSAGTFDMYALRGTPSTILVDRKGILRDISFGQQGNIESKINSLINE